MSITTPPINNWYSGEVFNNTQWVSNTSSMTIAYANANYLKFPISQVSAENINLLNVLSTTDSTSTSTGALIISGGVGITKNLYVGGSTAITNATDSTSTSTGALKISGGVGIVKNLYVGSSITTNATFVAVNTINSTTIDYAGGITRITTGGGGGSSGINLSYSTIYPMNSGGLIDNTIDLGTSGTRWKTLYAGTGTINTSDMTYKQNIINISEQEKNAAKSILSKFKRYKFVQSVKEKGDILARQHIGLMAQDIETIFENHGLNPGDYGMFIKSPNYKDNNGQEIDSNGIPYNDDSPNIIKTHVYGLRYDEVYAFIFDSMNDDINTLTEQMTLALNKITILEAQLL